MTEIEIRMQNLRQLHAEQLSQKSQLEQQLEATNINLMKIEGAYEALASYKSYSDEQDQTQSAASDETRSEAPETVN